MSLEVDFEVSQYHDRLSVSLFLSPVDLDVELSATPLAQCLPPCHHASHRDDKCLTRAYLISYFMCIGVLSACLSV